MAGVPHGGNMWKNIAIGIFTTVAAYLIVNYLTRNKGQKQEFKKKKEATIGVWQAIQKSNRYYYDDFFASLCSVNNKDAQTAMIHAIDKQIIDYELLQKKADLDDDMGLYINRFLVRLKDLKRYINEYAEATEKNEKNTSLTEDERKRAEAETDSLYLPKIQGLQNQDTASISSLMQGMVQKYGDNFPTIILLPEINEETATGIWTEGANKVFEFKKGNELVMTVDKVAYEGKWSLSNNILSLDFGGKEPVKYYIFLTGSRFIRFKLNPDDTEERQLCRQ